MSPAIPQFLMHIWRRPSQISGHGECYRKQNEIVGFDVSFPDRGLVVDSSGPGDDVELAATVQRVERTVTLPEGLLVNGSDR